MDRKYFGDKSKAVSKIVLGVVVAVLILLLGLICFLLHEFFKPVPGIVREVIVSPTGAYRIAIIDWSGGATAGESYLCVEKADDKHGFSVPGDAEPRDGLSLRQETLSTYGMDYTIYWDTDECFHAQWGRDDWLDLARVDLNDETGKRGRLKINSDNSYFDDYQIVDDKVFLFCKLYLENTFDEAVTYSISAYSREDYEGGLLADGNLVAVDGEGEKQQFVIDANTTAYLDVMFCGDLGTSERKASRNLPGVMRLEFAGFER